MIRSFAASQSIKKAVSTLEAVVDDPKTEIPFDIDLLRTLHFMLGLIKNIHNRTSSESLETGSLRLFCFILDDFRCYLVRGYFQVTDPRDIIYSVIGVHPHASRFIQPDYSLSREEVYADATQAVIEETGNLSVLGICDKFHLDNSKLRSWAPDWSKEISFRPICSPKSLRCSACGVFRHQIQPRNMSGRLLVHGTRLCCIGNPRHCLRKNE